MEPLDHPMMQKERVFIGFCSGDVKSLALYPANGGEQINDKLFSHSSIQ